MRCFIVWREWRCDAYAIFGGHSQHIFHIFACVRVCDSLIPPCSHVDCNIHHNRGNAVVIMHCTHAKMWWIWSSNINRMLGRCAAGIRIPFEAPWSISLCRVITKAGINCHTTIHVCIQFFIMPPNLQRYKLSVKRHIAATLQWQSECCSCSMHSFWNGRAHVKSHCWCYNLSIFIWGRFMDPADKKMVYG